jgi:hypothetical protein
VQAEEMEETSESEKEMVEPEPQRQPEPTKRKQPQVRPWDVGKEGELWFAFCLLTYLSQTLILHFFPLISNIVLYLQVFMHCVLVCV